MRARHITKLGKRQPEQSPGHVKCRLDHVLQLQIRFDHGFIQIELPFPQLGRVVAPVRGFQRLVVTFGNSNLCKHCRVVCSAGFRCRPYLAQQVLYRFRALGHGAVKLQFRETLITQKACFLVPQFQGFRHSLGIVTIATVLTTGGPGIKGKLTQIRPRRGDQERFNDRPRQRDHMLAVMAALGGSFCHGGNQAVRQSGQIFLLLQNQYPVFLISQHVLAKLRRQRRQPLIDRGKFLLFSPSQFCTLLHETLVMLFQHPDLFRRKAAFLAAVMQGANPGKQPIVHENGRLVFCQLRTNFTFHCLDRWRAVCTGPIPEQCLDFAQVPPDSSRTSMVLWKVAGSGLSAIASISAR